MSAAAAGEISEVSARYYYAVWGPGSRSMWRSNENQLPEVWLQLWLYVAKYRQRFKHLEVVLCARAVPTDHRRSALSMSPVVILAQHRRGFLRLGALVSMLVNCRKGVEIGVRSRNIVVLE
jgi:hypothetical protein